MGTEFGPSAKTGCKEQKILNASNWTFEPFIHVCLPASMHGVVNGVKVM